MDNGCERYGERVDFVRDDGDDFVELLNALWIMNFVLLNILHFTCQKFLEAKNMFVGCITRSAKYSYKSLICDSK